MLRLHVGVAPTPRRLKELPEMHLLPAVHDINHPLRLKRLMPIPDRCQVRRRIIESAIRFANEQRIVDKIAPLRDKKRIVLRRQLALGEKSRLRLRFPARCFASTNRPLLPATSDYKNFRPACGRTEPRAADKSHRALPARISGIVPEPLVLRIALLQQNQFALRRLSNGLVRLGFLLNLLVNRLEVPERIEPQLLRVASRL